MIIGFLGKGGSGKTTSATQTAQRAAARGMSVLAIDADHNMDLAFNLGCQEPFPYFGASIAELRKCCGLAPGQNYRDALAKDSSHSFSITPPDQYIKKYSQIVRSNIRLMVAGPHTDEILFDQSCSHSLTTPLKVLLPLFSLKENEIVIVDEKAGLDGAGTGIPSGFTAAIIVSEPTDHSIKAALGIKKLLDFFGTPYRFLLTKVRSEEEEKRGKEAFQHDLIGSIPANNEPLRETSAAYDSIIAFGGEIVRSGDARLERSRSKVERNRAFQTTLTH